LIESLSVEKENHLQLIENLNSETSHMTDQISKEKALIDSFKSQIGLVKADNLRQLQMNSKLVQESHEIIQIMNSLIQKILPLMKKFQSSTKIFDHLEENLIPEGYEFKLNGQKTHNQLKLKSNSSEKNFWSNINDSKNMSCDSRV
jgi:hypothetical protein